MTRPKTRDGRTRTQVYLDDQQLNSIQRLMVRYNLRTASDVIDKAILLLDRLDQGRDVTLYPRGCGDIKITSSVDDVG